VVFADVATSPTIFRSTREYDVNRWISRLSQVVNEHTRGVFALT
jgi:hypothetical protein